jgi:hypothetical protein
MLLNSAYSLLIGDKLPGGDKKSVEDPEAKIIFPFLVYLRISYSYKKEPGKIP